ncbi:MAG: sigma-70 family RNA polymerase sigma factor, partial [Bacteroidaceae bacterium]|nr:sigma-70 family RNA polymerase sigma factor [Bacteroidaceae bacterium]
FANTMNDRELVEALLNRDPFVTKLFYYRNCRPLFLSLIRRLERDGRVWEYDEVVSEIYALLMDDDGRRLRSFGFECSFYQWVKVVALHHLVAKMDKVVIDSESKEPLYEKQGEQAEDESVELSSARTDLERLLDLMPNQRYATVIRKLTLEGYESEELAREMNVKISNLYNIKKRAMAQLTEVALFDKKKYNGY